MNPDLINSFFEFFSGVLTLINVKKLLKDKVLKGISVVPQAFFTLWGLWNLFYYSHLNQWYSLIGGISIVSVNLVWVILAIYYSRKNKK